MCVSTKYASLTTCVFRQDFEDGKEVNIVNVMWERVQRQRAERLRTLEPIVVKRADGDVSLDCRRGFETTGVCVDVKGVQKDTKYLAYEGP